MVLPLICAVICPTHLKTASIASYSDCTQQLRASRSSRGLTVVFLPLIYSPLGFLIGCLMWLCQAGLTPSCPLKGCSRKFLWLLYQSCILHGYSLSHYWEHGKVTCVGQLPWNRSDLSLSFKQRRLVTMISPQVSTCHRAPLVSYMTIPCHTTESVEGSLVLDSFLETAVICSSQLYSFDWFLLSLKISWVDSHTLIRKSWNTLRVQSHITFVYLQRNTFNKNGWCKSKFPFDPNSCQL